MNTVISSAASGITVTFYPLAINRKKFEVDLLCHSIIAGMVSITAAADNVELWASAVIGFVAACIYLATKELLIRYEIDDPLDITQKHGICGLWSLLATGIFDKDKGFLRTGLGSFLVI